MISAVISYIVFKRELLTQVACQYTTNRPELSLLRYLRYMPVGVFVSVWKEDYYLFSFYVPVKVAIYCDQLST